MNEEYISYQHPLQGDRVPLMVLKTDTVSDGFHTFGDLYDHRITLFIKLAEYWDMRCQEVGNNSGMSWRSLAHHPDDKPMYANWFVLGIGKESGDQITYHLPLSRWDETDFARTLDHAPKWDGHSPSDVINRLKKL